MNMDDVKKASKETLVPLSAVIALFTSIVGYGELKAQVAQSKEDIKDNRAVIRELAKGQHRMEMRQYGMQIRMGMKNVEPVPDPIVEE